MFRLPPNLRSGNKVQPVPLSAADKKPAVQRSLSTSSASSPSKSSMVDPATIEGCVNKYLSGGDVFDRLITKLSQHVKTAVEEAVKAAMLSFNKELASLRSELAGVKEDLLVRTDELEQYQRRNSLRVFGVKETEAEDTDAIVVQLCQEKLGVQLTKDAICRSHRVGRKLGPTPDGRQHRRAIIVKFVSYRDRRLVYGSKKKLKGSGITLKEDLTARRMEVLKAAVERHGLRNTWTQDGKVLWVDRDGRRGAATSLRDFGDATSAT